MAERKLLAGQPVRRLRRRAGLTQAAMAEMLGVSPSYLNLVERNHRPLSATLLVRLAEQFDFDPRTLAGGEPGGGTEAMRRRLADPLFADLEIERAEVDEWLAAAPGGAEAFARLFDRAGGDRSDASTATEPLGEVQREIERWRNHFGDLDAGAETLADELRLVGADLYGAIVERLRVKHGLSIRVLPVDVMPDVLRRLDLHARQLQLSEALDAAGRTFAAAYQLAAIEMRGEIEAVARGAGFAERTAERLFRRHLSNYAAAAIVMPYVRFLRACEASGYDLDLLGHRFGVGFEALAHRLTTLQRVGARGLAFFMIRIDPAGQASKRHVGASGSMLVANDARCPLWRLHHVFARPGETVAQLVEMEDGARWLTIQRAVPPRGWGDIDARFAIGLGVAAAQAGGLAIARGLDLGRAGDAGRPRLPRMPSARMPTAVAAADGAGADRGRARTPRRRAAFRGRLNS